MSIHVYIGYIDCIYIYVLIYIHIYAYIPTSMRNKDYICLYLSMCRP